MVSVVDETLTRDYIRTLEGFVENGLRAIESARRWPWKRHDLPRLLHETAHNLVVRGINFCALGEAEKARSSFSQAAALAADRFKNIESVYLGYHDAQAIAAAVSAGEWATAEKVANLAMAVSTQHHLNPVIAGPNAGVRAVLAWLTNMPDVIQAEREKAVSSGLEQFELWADMAFRASNGDADGLRAAMESLTKFVRKNVRSGDFRYSEDRLGYLPGQMLLRLAERDSVSLKIPDEPWWRACPQMLSRQ